MRTEIGLKHDLKVIKPEEIHHLLEPGELGVVLELTVTDPKTGKVTEHRVIPSKSFVQQFLQLLFAKMICNISLSTVSIRDTSNILRNVYLFRPLGVTLHSLACNAGAGIVTNGIIVGTDNTAPIITHYALLAPIAHGVAGGQMQYSAMTFGAPGADATTSQVTLTRNFTANVGGITVNEIGLYVIGYDGADRYFMTIRDANFGGIVVPAGQTLTVNYREQAVI